MTGGFKSSLLLYLVAKEISDKNTNAIIVPCVTRRINSVNEDGYDRPDSLPIVKSIVDYVSSKYPNVKFYNPVTINVDFWWYTNGYNPERNIYNVSEKSLFESCYTWATKKWFFETLNPSEQLVLTGGIPTIINYNAFTSIPEDADYPEHLKHRQKHYKKAKLVSIPNGKMYEFYDGDAISILPFYNITDKTALFQLATSLGIFDDLSKIAYSCEQSTTVVDSPCGVCFNCVELSKFNQGVSNK